MRTTIPDNIETDSMSQKLYVLRCRQALPLDAKIVLSKQRITEFYRACDGKVYVSSSGGVDSLVLGHLVNELYPEVPLVFCDTGLEYPELKDNIKKFTNLIIIRPSMNFKEVLNTYGYPVVSKRTAQQIRIIRENKDSKTGQLYLTGITSTGKISKCFQLKRKWKFLLNAPFKISEKCCDVMKKQTFHTYEKETKRRPYMGLMADDSDNREALYLKQGSCNNYQGRKSSPMMFWKKSDVFEYIQKFNLSYPKKVYGDIICKNGIFSTTGVQRTGCIFCMFGVHLERRETGENRFQKMYRTHPQLWKYCMYDLGIKEILDFIGEPSEPEGWDLL